VGVAVLMPRRPVPQSVEAGFSRYIDRSLDGARDLPRRGWKPSATPPEESPK
jgi:hypothetical protein